MEHSNQSELRLEGDDDNDMFTVRAFALAAVVDFDWDNDGDIDIDDLFADSTAFPGTGYGDTNGDGTINLADAELTVGDFTDDVIVVDENGRARAAHPSASPAGIGIGQRSDRLAAAGRCPWAGASRR